MASAWAQSQPASGGALARALNDSFASVYEKVAPAVVVIEVKRPGSNEVLSLPEGLNFLLRNPNGTQVPLTVDQGSGFVISADGYIVTNQHVVSNAVENGIKVTLQDGRKFAAELVGLDEKSDIAVLKIEGKDLPTVELADSDDVRVGQFAFAIGAPFDLPYTFTVGVVSAKGRSNLIDTPDYQEYLQTDASINPGNSGGPLCDIDGKVVGVNTLISGMNRGLGFAIPMNMAKSAADQLIATGKVSRPWLGISIESLDENEMLRSQFPDLSDGVVVRDIQPNTPAYQSELRAGDVILKVDGVTVSKARDLQKEILAKSIGQQVKLEVSRNGRNVDLVVQTGEQPSRMIRASNRRYPAPQADPSTQWQERQRPGKPGQRSDGQGLGLRDARLDNGNVGALVTEVADGSAAAAAGLMPGDIVTEAGGKPIRSAADLQALLAQSDASRGVMLMVDRRGQKTYAILKP